MDDTGTPAPGRLAALLEAGETGAAAACVDRLRDAPAADRKSALRDLRSIATATPSAFEGLLEPLATFLDDDDRSVRLTAVKLFSTVAAAAPTVALSVVPTLAARLGDDEEFYFVRARAAEALGYVAVEHPGAVASPDLVADLRVGLAFDEPEVAEKLAKALAYVAIGDPGRLRHRVDDLASHLDADGILVRYYLCTALTAVGCSALGDLAPASEALLERLADEDAFVRGRAAEALGCHARGPAAAVPRSDLAALTGAEEDFVAERAAFAVDAIDGRTGDEVDEAATESDGVDAGGGPSGDVGTVEGLRATVEDAAERIAAPPADGACPHCGLELPDPGPPTCPGCGGPR
jgi:HEAT repeat protein